MKNKGCISAIIVLVVLVIIGGIGYSMIAGRYNKLVNLNNNVDKNWSDVETVYQKRANLIPNLERTVKSYAQYEKGTFKEVTEARAKATGINIDPSNMTSEDMAKFQAAQSQFSGSLSRLLAVVENYPNLKADQQYINFQREMTAIENSIRFETVNFNTAAQAYNTYRESFPTNVIANTFFGSKFKTKPYFKADAGAQKAPQVFTDEQ